MIQQDKEKMKLKARMEETEDEIADVLKSIFKKPIQNLTDYEKGFLRARASYLDDMMLAKYDKILKEKKEVHVQEIDESVLEAMARADLEKMAIELGIENPENKNKFKKNSDLMKAIKEKQQEKIDEQEKE